MSSQPSDLTGFDAPKRRQPGEILGHPTCLFTLFFTEMWERFSFYGMKALLILYMVNYLYWTQEDGSTVMMWYAGLAYFTPIFGGILADKVFGARWSVVIGGVLMAIGHFLLAFEPMVFFFSGLGFLIVGCGFLKPNISTQVGGLYRENDERRDAAFTIFYMGINLGAFIGPLICGWLQIHYGYHYGFAAAGIGMVVGLIVYIAGMQSVVRREKMIAEEDAAAKAAEEESGGSAGEVEAASSLESAGTEEGGVSLHRKYRDRSLALFIICLFAVLFWVGFEQAANVMNLWADKHTNMFIFRGSAPEVSVDLPDASAAAVATDAAASSTGGLKDVQMSAAQTQSINPFYIFTLAPLFAWFWTFLEKRKKQPSTPVKMAFGVFFLTLAYGAMLTAARTENKPSSAPLASVPEGVTLDKYGATRMSWEDGTLHMNGVLTDLDWMRALGASANEPYQAAVADLVEQAEERAEAARIAKDTSGWEVDIVLPAEAGEVSPVAEWPESIEWDSATRTFKTTDVVAERYRNQLLAAGAEPEFHAAITSIYKQSSVFKVSIGWLLAFYLLCTIGELCLSPVGLSLVTKAAPPKYRGMFMGLWFFTTGFMANFLAHLIGGRWGTMTPTEYFMIFGALAAVATVIMLLLMGLLRRMLHGVH